MSKVTICVGIPASGKSTWAREEANKTCALIICRDDIRIELGLKHGDNEMLVTDWHRDKIRDAINYGFDVIIADTNINKSNRNRLIQFCLQRQAGVELVIFPISLEEAIKRDANRTAQVGADVIKRMYLQMQLQNFVGYKTV